MAGLVLVAFFLSILFSGVTGVKKTQEIDDADVGPYSLTNPPLGTIAFLPPNNGYWGTQQGAAQTMVAVADAVRAHEGTYTAASSFAGTTPRSIVIDFFGTSITPYFTLSNNFVTECDITLDDKQLYELRHTPGSRQEDFSYKVPGVTYVDLAPGLHRLEIKVRPFTEGPTGRLNFVSFDYAEFTYDTTEAEGWLNRTSTARLGTSPDVETSKDGGNQTAAIVGGTLGGAAVLAALVLVIYFRSRRSRGMSSSDSSSIEKIHHHNHPRRQSVFPRWFGSFTAAHSSSGPTPDPSTMPSISTHQPHPGGSGGGGGGHRGHDGDRHSMVSSMSTSTKAHPMYLHIGPDGNSQWLSSPSEVHRLHLNSMSPQQPIHHGSPGRRNSDDRLDSLGLHLNTIQTPKTPYQTVASPGGGSIAAAARELHTPYQYSIPDPPPPSGSSGHR